MSSSRRPDLEGFHRTADDRAMPDLVDEARADAASHVLVIAGDAAPLDEPGRLHWSAAADVPDGGEWAFLGRDATGSAVLAAVFARSDDELFAAPGGWGGLRVVGGTLPAREAEIFIEALSLGRWLLDAPFCPACGTRTRLEKAGWSRTCPHCGREHFPGPIRR